MNFDLMKVANGSVDILKKNSPKILLFGGIGLGALAVAGSGLASFKASDILREIHEDPEICCNKKKLAGAYAKRILPLYIPVAFLEAGSVICLVKSYDINAKRLAAATALAEVSVETLRLYKEKAKKAIGEEKVKELEEEVKKEQESKDEAKRQEGSDEKFYNYDIQWFHDTLSGLDFLSTENNITRANLKFAERLNIEMQMSKNDWLDILKEYSIPVEDKYMIGPVQGGEQVGWVWGQTIHVYMDKVGKTKIGNHPCIMLTYSTRPFENFRNVGNGRYY